MTKFLREYAALFAGRIGSAVFGVVSLSLLARLLGADGYGQVTLIVMLGTVCATLFLNWPNAAVVRFGREELLHTGRLQKTFWARAVLLTLCAVAVLVLLFAFRSALSEYVGLDADLAIACVWSFAVALALYEMAVVALQGADRVASSGIVHFAAKAILAALLVGAWLTFGQDLPVETVVTLQVSSTVLVAIGALVAIRRYLGSPSLSIRSMTDAAGYTWAIVIGSTGGVIVRWVDVTIINHYLDLESVGTYAIAYQISTFIGMATASITSVVFPAIVSYKSKGQLDRIHTFLDAIIPQAMLGWNVFLAIVCLVIQFALPALLGEAYHASVWPLQILLVGLGFNAIGRLYTGVTNAFDLLKHVALLSVGVGAINVVGDVLLVPRIGIEGAAISTALAFAITHQSYIYLINRASDLTARKTRYLVNLFPLIPATVAIAGVSLSTPGQIVALITSTAAGIAIARQAGFFSKHASEWAETAKLPAFLRRRLTWLYSALAPR